VRNRAPVNAESDQKKTRLLVLTTTFPRWVNDVEPPFVFELCRRLKEFEVHVVAPHAPGAATEEVMDGVHVHRFRYALEKLETLAFDGGIAANLKRSPWKYALLQWFLLGMFFRAFQVGRKYDIHLIHAHWMIPTGLIGATLRELLPGENKLLVTAHGGDVHSLKSSIFKRLRTWVANEADAATAVSHNLAEAGIAEGWPKDTLLIAPMGVNLKHTFTPKQRSQDFPTLVFAGRLVQKKGIQHLIEAMPNVCRQFPGCQLLVAGDGPLLESLKERCEKLEIVGQVQFLGRYQLEELPDILRRGNIATLPFDTAEDGDVEGLGLTAVEAMGCGIPVIVGDVAAVRDVVTPSKNGVVVNSRNHDQLSQAIIELLGNQELRKCLAEQAIADVRSSFDWDICAERYQLLLLKLAEKK